MNGWEAQEIAPMAAVEGAALAFGPPAHAGADMRVGLRAPAGPIAGYKHLQGAAVSSRHRRRRARAPSARSSAYAALCGCRHALWRAASMRHRSESAPEPAMRRHAAAAPCVRAAAAAALPFGATSSHPV